MRAAQENKTVAGSTVKAREKVFSCVFHQERVIFVVGQSAQAQ